MRKSQIRFQADLKLAQMEQMETMEVKDFNLDKASALVKKIADIKTAHHLEMLKAMKEVRAILTEDQFKKLKAMKPMKQDHRKPEKSMKHNH
jgi:Spy/CpxP family protein refolding chaperone